MESKTASKIFEYGVHYREEEIKSKSIMIAQSPPFLVADTPSGIYYFESNNKGRWHLIEITKTIVPVVELANQLRVMKANEVKGIFEGGEVGATFELTVSDTKTGLITEHRPPQKSKSFVRGFLELLWIQGNQLTEMTMYLIRDTSNVQHYMMSNQYNFDTTAAITIDTYGIQVGLGVVAPTINDYALGTKITHGVGLNQLQYSVHSYGAPASDATTSQFTITRNFANASGALVTPTEIGLVVRSYRPAIAYYVLAIRDVIGGGIAVPNGQTLTVNYRPQTVV